MILLAQTIRCPPSPWFGYSFTYKQWAIPRHRLCWEQEHKDQENTVQPPRPVPWSPLPQGPFLHSRVGLASPLIQPNWNAHFPRIPEPATTVCFLLSFLICCCWNSFKVPFKWHLLQEAFLVNPTRSSLLNRESTGPASTWPIWFFPSHVGRGGQKCPEGHSILQRQQLCFLILRHLPQHFAHEGTWAKAVTWERTSFLSFWKFQQCNWPGEGLVLWT